MRFFIQKMLFGARGYGEENNGEGGGGNADSSGDGGASDGGDDNPSGDNGANDGITAAELEEFRAFRAFKKQNKAPNTTKSAYDKMQESKESANSDKDKESEIRDNVLFESGFDTFMEKNKGLFSATSQSIKEAAQGLSGSELTHTLRCTAAKDFFANDENLKLLSDADQEFIKSAVIGKHDNNIDSKKAWRYIESALHISNRLKQHGSFRNGSNNADGADTPNVTAYLDKCKNANKPEKAA